MCDFSRVDRVFRRCERDRELCLQAGRPRCYRPDHTSFAPSALVDQGWHTFILDTRAYAEFCDRIAGTFLHHHPTDGPVSGPGLPTAADTAAFMTRAGISHDPALWDPAAAATCWPPSMEAGAPTGEAAASHGVWAPDNEPVTPICIWVAADPATAGYAEQPAPAQ